VQISEISAADLGGLRGLGLAAGDVEARAADAGVELTEAISPNALAPADAPAPIPGSGSTNFDLSPPTLSPSVGTQTGLTGRKLTLALDTKVAAAIKRPSTAAKLVSKVKAAKGKVRVTPQAAKALVKSIEKVSPAAAQQAAKTLAPAVTTAPAAAPAASSAPVQVAVEADSSKMRRWLIWGGIGVAVLGAAFLFLRRRSSAVRVVPSVTTAGLERYDEPKKRRRKSKKSSKRKSSKK